MRVAVALYGQPRNYQSGYENIMEFMKYQTENLENLGTMTSNTKIEFDVFYHCWTLGPNEYFSCSPWRNINPSSLIYKEDTPEMLKQLYNPVAYLYENQSQMTIDEGIYKDTLVFNNTKTHSSSFSAPTQINNTLFSLYSRNQVRNLLNDYICATNTKYDAVIITRFDMNRLPTIRLFDLDLTSTYVSSYHLPRKIMPDPFIITPVETFLKWFDIYKNLDVILNNPELSDLVRQNGEVLCINNENLILASYLLHFGQANDIKYFDGGVYTV